MGFCLYHCAACRRAQHLEMQQRCEAWFSCAVLLLLENAAKYCSFCFWGVKESCLFELSVIHPEQMASGVIILTFSRHTNYGSWEQEHLMKLCWGHEENLQCSAEENSFSTVLPLSEERIKTCLCQSPPFGQDKAIHCLCSSCILTVILVPLFTDWIVKIGMNHMTKFPG